MNKYEVSSLIRTPVKWQVKVSFHTGTLNQQLFVLKNIWMQIYPIHYTMHEKILLPETFN